MVVVPLLHQSALDPEILAAASEAFDKALVLLGQRVHSDKIAELLARRIIDVAMTGERDPDRMRLAAIASLGRPFSPASQLKSDGDLVMQAETMIAGANESVDPAMRSEFLKLAKALLQAAGVQKDEARANAALDELAENMFESSRKGSRRFNER